MSQAALVLLGVGLRQAHVHQGHRAGPSPRELPDAYPADQRRKNRSVNTRPSRITHHKPRKAGLMVISRPFQVALARSSRPKQPSNLMNRQSCHFRTDQYAQKQRQHTDSPDPASD